MAIALQVVLPETVIRGLGPRWFIPALESALLVALIVTNPGEINRESRLLRAMSLTLIGIITVANIVALGELVSALLNHSPAGGGRSLVFASVPIWLTNVIVFGLWYWDLDRGGSLLASGKSPPPGLPLSSDVHSRVRPELDARLSRLSLHIIYQRDRI